MYLMDGEKGRLFTAGEIIDKCEKGADEDTWRSDIGQQNGKYQRQENQRVE
jgi:hypothetical protein